MDWLLLFDLLLLGFGSLIFVHSFFFNLFIKPLHEGIMQADEKEVKA